MYHIFFIHLSVDGLLGCFCILAIVNKVAPFALKPGRLGLLAAGSYWESQAAWSWSSRRPPSPASPSTGRGGRPRACRAWDLPRSKARHLRSQLGRAASSAVPLSQRRGSSVRGKALLCQQELLKSIFLLAGC